MTDPLPTLVELVDADRPPALAQAGALMRDYAASLTISLDFQDFDNELARLPGDYAPPGGAVLLARLAGVPCGCVAMRPLDGPGVCEMKRLYVSPAARNTGAGRQLAQAIVERARRAGYRRMRLDTLASMTRARALYQSLGFVPIAPYCYNPHADAIFLELAL